MALKQKRLNIRATEKLRFESYNVAKILAYEEEKLRNSHDLKRPLCDANVFVIYTTMYMGIY